MFYDVTRLDLDKKRTVIEVLDHKLTTSKRRQKVHLDVRNKVILLPTEPIVGLFLDHDNHISRFSCRRLVAFPSELYRLAPLHSLVDVDLQEFLFRKDFLPFTIRTSILCVNYFARPLAIVARRLNLLNHGSHLAESDLNSSSAAIIAWPHSTFLATFPFAFGTNHVSR